MVGNKIVLSTLKYTKPLLLLCVYAYSADNKCPVSSNFDLAMTPGFITVAVNAAGKLEYGTCSNSGACIYPLASCPNATCCLSSGRNKKGCGCWKSFGEERVCEDPNVLQVNTTGCDRLGHPRKSSIQIAFGSSKTCTSTTETEVNVLQDGTITIKFSNQLCLTNVKREANQRVQMPVWGVFDGVLELGHGGVFKKNGLAAKLLQNIRAEDLAEIMDMDKLNNILRHKKLPPAENVDFSN